MLELINSHSVPLYQLLFPFQASVPPPSLCKRFRNAECTNEANNDCGAHYVSEPRAVATGSMRNVDGTTQLTAFLSQPIIDPLVWLIPSLPLRVLTPSPTALLDHIQRTP